MEPDNKKIAKRYSNAARAAKMRQADPYVDLAPIKKGKASEAIFLAHCLRSNIEAFGCHTEDGKIDFIVGSQLARCQVKTFSHATQNVQLRKVRGGGGARGCETYLYTKKDIDYMVAVDLVDMAVWVMPIEDLVNYTVAISLTAMNTKFIKNDISMFKMVP